MYEMDFRRHCAPIEQKMLRKGARPFRIPDASVTKQLNQRESLGRTGQVLVVLVPGPRQEWHHRGSLLTNQCAIHYPPPPYSSGRMVNVQSRDRFNLFECPHGLRLLPSTGNSVVESRAGSQSLHLSTGSELQSQSSLSTVVIVPPMSPALS